MATDTATPTTPINILAISDYQLMLDAYRGSGGFKTGAYLVKHKREADEDLAERQQVSHYHNYTKPVINSHVEPIFRKQITRDGPKSELWGELSKNIDLAGKGIDDFMKSAAVAGRRDGLHFLSVSAPVDAPATKSDALAKRPWAYRISALAIKAVERDQHGRVVSISWTFEEGEKTLIRTLTGTGWTTTGAKGETVEGEGYTGEWKTKRETAPVVMICPQDWDDDEEIPTPEFLGIARTNHRIFNQTSELDEIERNMCFPMWVYPSKDPGNITIGTNNIMGYDPEYKMEPNPKSPSKDSFESLAAGIKRNIDEIYRMAGLSSANVEGTLTQSGKAKQLDRAQLDASLSSYGEYLSDREQELWELLGWIAGADLTTTVSYPSEFTSADLDVELAALASALAISAGPLFAAEARKRMARVVLPMTDTETLADIDKEIEAMKEADGKDDTPPGGNDNPPKPGDQLDENGNPVESKPDDQTGAS